VRRPSPFPLALRLSLLPPSPCSSRCKHSGLSTSLYRIMGRKRSPKEAFKRAKTNGYRYRTHHEGVARGSAPLICRRPSEIRVMLRSAMRCTSECRFGCARMFRLTNLCRWLASFNKEKHDEGAPFLDETDVPYTTGPQSVRAALPPLDLATTKDVLRHYAVVSDGTLDPQ